MLFKTIYINKRRLAAVCAVIAMAGAAAAVCKCVNPPAVEVFNSVEEDKSYTDVLDAALPSDEKKSTVKDAVKAFLGFDGEDPKSVISEFSPMFASDNNAAHDSEEETDNTPKPEVSAEPAAFPSKSEIASGNGLEINNATSYSVNLKELCAGELSFTVEQGAGPQVLIVHTHTTECYDGDAMSGETERSTDEEKNMIAIGNIFADVLESRGIHCVHDKTVHDYPTYQGAYTRALSTIAYNLKQYPEIKIVLDIHRDAYIYPDGSKLTVKCEQNGVPTAKVMLVAGTDSLGLNHPKWRENLALAAKIQSAANIMYPSMMRPINLRRERFNMHMTAGSLLIEVGSNGNTIAEAKEGARNTANAIAAVLNAQ